MIGQCQAYGCTRQVWLRRTTREYFLNIIVRLVVYFIEGKGLIAINAYAAIKQLIKNVGARKRQKDEKTVHPRDRWYIKIQGDMLLL